MAEQKMPLDAEEVTPEIISPEEVRRRHENRELKPKKKRSFGSRFKDLIFVAGPEEVKESLIEDVIKPSIRDFIADMLYTAVDVAVYGRSGTGRKHRKGGRVTVGNDKELTDYNGIFSRGRKKPKKTNGYDFKDVRFDDRHDADNAFEELYDMLCEKNVVDVATYYDIARENGGHVLVEEDHTDRDWGWRSLEGTGYHRDGDGYALLLPKPEWLKR